jgi:hypothetical protein
MLTTIAVKTSSQAYIHADLRKAIKPQNHATPKTNNTIYITILIKTRDTRADHIIHGYSTVPYRARKNSLEVAWGVHVHICSRNRGPTPTCAKCLSPLNNTHIMGGCKHTAKLRTKRHNNTFLLLHQLLQNTNGGRWPIIGLDLGNKPITYFSNNNIDAEEIASPTSNLYPI